ncbi:MAG: AAA family ATPase [Bacteroidia bacterium]
MKIDITEIAAKKQKLEEVKAQLKSLFIGIDNIIDDLINYIQIWYLMPEVLNRPIIINLWGMTGVGKTDLIRKMVKYLEYQDRFTEVELSNIDSTTWQSSVSSILERNDMNDGKPAIVLFDEIQRFNTLDGDGKPMGQTKFTDFWELLSDGRLSKKEKEDLDYYLTSYLFQNKENQKRKEKGEEVEEAGTIGFWEAQNFKRMLGLDKDVLEISDLTKKDMFDMIMKEKKQKKIYEPIDHSKTLIIISGNLDEAFDMARQTSEAEIDADIFHAYTQKVTLVDIKDALTRKFRPEQVARFGNIHLIYTSLKKNNFEQLITREINRIIRDTKSRFDITLQIDESLNHLVYRNGVFPVQGVRPVFSSVTDIIETNLSQFLFVALMGGNKKIKMWYNTDTSEITAKIGKETVKIHYVGRIDKIRESNVADVTANISVHEAGHALVYMLLFGMAPLQLKSKVASSYAGGFTFPHQLHETKEVMLKKIKIFLAGGLAEEMIFGKENASIGRSHDRETATTITIDFIRRYGFDEEFQASYMLEFAYGMDKTVTDDDVEKMVVRMVNETKELLITHRQLLIDLSKELCFKGSMEGKEVAEFAEKHNIEVKVQPEGYLHINGFEEALNKAK